MYLLLSRLLVLLWVTLDWQWLSAARPKWNDGNLVKDGVEAPPRLIAEQPPIVAGDRVLSEQYVAGAK
jgi:hypothetical protein